MGNTYKDLIVLCKLATLIMVDIAGLANNKEPTLQASWIILRMHNIYHLTLYNIRGPRSRCNISQILFVFQKRELKVEAPMMNLDHTLNIVVSCLPQTNYPIITFIIN